MANEAVIIELPRNIHPVMRTVADSGTIEKGTLLVLSDPNTVAASTGTGDIFGGIAAAEKVTLDGSTKLAVHLHGVFDLKNSPGPAITVGSWVTSSGTNLIRLATEAEVLLGKGIGIVEETAAGDEVSRVRLRGY